MLYGRVLLITFLVILGSLGLFALDWFKDSNQYKIVTSGALLEVPPDNEGRKWTPGRKLATGASPESMQASTSSEASDMIHLTLTPKVDKVVRVTVQVPLETVIFDKPSPTVYINGRNLARKLAYSSESSDDTSQEWTNYYAKQGYDLAKLPSLDLEVRCSRCPRASVLEFAILEQLRPRE